MVIVVILNYKVPKDLSKWLWMSSSKTLKATSFIVFYMPIKVKLFINDSEVSLQNLVNEWLDENKIERHDLMYATLL